ncbi:hypothetical protein HQ563_06900 [bacterium]|nr:hypothetical protein [bacterium]
MRNRYGFGSVGTISIDSDIHWQITNVEGTGTIAEASHWKEFWHQWPPPDPGHTEWWFTGHLAGASEGKVKVRAVLTYVTRGYPLPEIHFLSGPEHEVEVRGFVDVRLDDVGEWGEEEPGAFMAKGGMEDLTLRTCTAGDVVLSWNSDKIGLYTDSACEEEDKVVEDEGSVEGSRRAFPHPSRPAASTASSRIRRGFGRTPTPNRQRIPFLTRQTRLLTVLRFNTAIPPEHICVLTNGSGYDITMSKMERNRMLEDLLEWGGHSSALSRRETTGNFAPFRA